MHAMVDALELLEDVVLLVPFVFCVLVVVARNWSRLLIVTRQSTSEAIIILFVREVSIFSFVVADVLSFPGNSSVSSHADVVVVRAVMEEAVVVVVVDVVVEVWYSVTVL